MNYEGRIKEILTEEAAAIAERAVVEVRWVEADEIQALNNEHRGIDKATDVLSFPLYSYLELESQIANRKSQTEPILLGSLVLCEEIVREHANDEGVDYEEQVDWSLRHGIRHLLGYDHDETGDIWQPMQ